MQQDADQPTKMAEKSPEDLPPTMAEGTITSLENNTSTSQAQLNRRILRKLDLRLAPLFAVLYFVAYLDRSNIGNASVAGMTSDLNVSDAQFSTAVSLFYATYVPLEIPVVLGVQKLGPQRAISLMCVGWAAVTIGTAFVGDYGDLIAVRLLLGVCESGFFPSLSFYIASVYKREEQGLRIAYLFSSASLAGMFGGLIGTAITTIGDKSGLPAWSWLYVIEGCITAVVVVWVFFCLPNDPTKAGFWDNAEQEVMEMRELERKEYIGNQVFEWAEVWRAFKDPKVWASAFIQFCQDIILYGFSTFLPSILKLDLGFSSMQAQYLSVPVYFVGGVSFLTAAIMGDKWRLRGTILFGLNTFAVIGYAILLGVPGQPWVRYFACFLIAIPLYCGPGMNETWISNNVSPHYRRATAIGLNQTIGNLAGVVAPQVYRSPPYKLGHGFSLGAVLVSMLLIGLQILHLRMQNRHKDEIAQGTRPDNRRETAGEGSLEFKYIY